MSEEIRILAFYLPQFHPIPENDEWWGKGFTEWTNVRKAQPRFPGHYQPHVPGQLGYYDLRDPKARAAQADLAREYGIHGFCYYHYWFNGKRLLETPFNEVLRTGEPDFPFCLCWANENWTRCWDGEDKLILMQQQYGDEDDARHIQSLFKAFDDKRYIRIHGKPLFLVYRTENMPNPAKTAEIWRREARAAGIGELYLAQVESLGETFTDPGLYNFDAKVEFAPDSKNRGFSINPNIDEIQSIFSECGFSAEIFLENGIRYYGELADRMSKKCQRDYVWFRCVTPSWDNSARRNEKANIYFGSTPYLYHRWLNKILKYTKNHLEGDEQIIFINGWNEWAEGNHLEPDVRYGKAYLEATRNAIIAESFVDKDCQDTLDVLKECSYKQRLTVMQRQIDNMNNSLGIRFSTKFRSITKRLFG